MVGIWVSIVSMVGISEVVSVSIVTIKVSSISLSVSISGPLAVVVSSISIWVSVVSVVSVSKMMSIVSVVGIGKRMAVVSVVSIGISFSLWLGFGISGPFAVVSVMVAIGVWVSVVSMVGIS